MKITILSTVCALSLSSCSCSDSKSSDSKTYPDSNEEIFFADFDIAMTVCSIADAIKVGEPLDSTEYDFTGVLTDGQGTPIYTSVDGSPGIWNINVIDNGKVSIKSLNLGDLLPKDLEAYILESLKLSADNRIAPMPDSLQKAKRTVVSVYDIPGGYIRYEVMPDTTPNGLSGDMVTITLGVTPLLAGGTQIAG